MTLTHLLTLIFLLIITNTCIDLTETLTLQEMALRFFVKGLTLAITLYTAHFVWKKFTIEKKSKESIAQDLERAKQLAKKWEHKSTHYVEEFQSFVSSQFDSWGLSKSEREIALLILKGKASKDIAAHRFTSERTIRNQCRSIYEKSQLGGKNEFCAFFLSELIHDFSL